MQLTVSANRQWGLSASIIASVAIIWSIGAPLEAAQPRTTEEVRIVLHDYIDGQLEGNSQRVAGSLHPDLAKRAALSSNGREVFPLRRMSADELVDLTIRRELETPREQWVRSITILHEDDRAAIARIDTPWFTDHLQLARFGDRWLIVNALWVPISKSGEIE